MRRRNMGKSAENKLLKNISFVELVNFNFFFSSTIGLLSDTTQNTLYQISTAFDHPADDQSLRNVNGDADISEHLIDYKFGAVDFQRLLLIVFLEERSDKNKYYIISFHNKSKPILSCCTFRFNFGFKNKLCRLNF